MTARQALETTKTLMPQMDAKLHEKAMRFISSAAARGKYRTAFFVNAGLWAQDGLTRRLVEDGYRVDWATASGPRTEDGGVIVISWKEAK